MVLIFYLLFQSKWKCSSRHMIRTFKILRLNLLKHTSFSSSTLVFLLFMFLLAALLQGLPVNFTVSCSYNRAVYERAKNVGQLEQMGSQAELVTSHQCMTVPSYITVLLIRTSDISQLLRLPKTLNHSEKFSSFYSPGVSLETEEVFCFRGLKDSTFKMYMCKYYIHIF